MVRTKMEQREYIILCLEDSNDWSNATTRRLVMQVRAEGGGEACWCICVGNRLLSVPPLHTQLTRLQTHNTRTQPACPPPQVDPSLTRTVVVSTKLDTRIPQFARPHDVEMYLRPPSRLLEPTMLGGSPFFT